MGVGVQRAGTSWWFDLLAAHPGCGSDPDLKELHYFDRFWAQPFGDAEVAGYHDQFRARSDLVVGEWTPRYVHDPWVPAMLARAAPSARVLLLLRDPLERYRSGLTHSLDHDGLSPTALVATDAFARGLYGAQLRRLLAHFAPTQVLVLQYELCVAEPRRQLARTYAFCGLDPAFVPDGIEERRLGTQGEKAPLPSATAAALAAAYRDDLEALTVLAPDLDLRSWPTAAVAGLVAARAGA